ncbi:hypothetical protein [Borrelia sp. A-FGy1]|uniref:hypothetical protein n=1 Tax=Borrelia sp. A-FGy1 TaxID=2608247 RepID=UPI0018E07963|nr:hypothetical protein [Borrelia sp. A-FGy1]
MVRVHILFINYLTKKSFQEFKADIRWNFTKFLVDREIRVVCRYDSLRLLQ